MSIYNIGRVCVKIAGRDAGRRCVVLTNAESSLVLIDGETRRKKVNVKHLEPTEKVVEISENADHKEVEKVCSSLEWNIWNKKSKSATERPMKVRKVKVKKEEKPAKKAAKVEKKTTKKETVKENKKATMKEVKAEPKVEAKKEVVKKEVPETVEKK